MSLRNQTKAEPKIKPDNLNSATSSHSGRKLGEERRPALSSIETHQVACQTTLNKSYGGA